MKEKEFKKIKERVFKPLKNLNAEIRFIENEQYEDKKVYWVVDVGILETIGEKGYNYTFFYDNYPTEKEIIQDIEEHIKEHIKDLKDKILSGYEENHLKELLKIELKGGLKE